METIAPNVAEQNSAMRAYYRFHASVYDATRWTFLFGRNKLVEMLPVDPAASSVLLEVGCGTGHNLVRLGRRCPEARLIGVDVSSDMLRQATRRTKGMSRRVFLFERPYTEGSFQLSLQPDVVLCSYSLTMFNPGWEAAIDRAWQDLRPGGHIAVVDFHDSPSTSFRWWMERNHVRMDGHLLPALKQRFETVTEEVHPAAGGLWRYFLYVGRKG